jgi:hypothetical protein
MQSCNKSALVTVLPGATAIYPSRPAPVSGAQVVQESLPPSSDKVTGNGAAEAGRDITCTFAPKSAFFSPYNILAFEASMDV